jgi:hypothetical protein
VPVREGIDGNEMEDQLTKLGYEHPFTEAKPPCGISVRVAKKAFRDWTIRDHRKQWDSISGLTQAKTLKQRPSAKKQGAVKLEQKPVTMGTRTTHRTPPPKRTGSGKQPQV